MRVLIVEDQLFVQNSIREMLHYSKRTIECHFSLSPENAIHILRDAIKKNIRFDLVISDLQYENGNKSFDVIEFCKGNNIPVMVFSMFENPAIVKLAMSIGALGYISKLDDVNEIIKGFNILLNGNTFFSQRINRALEKTDFEWEPHPLVLTIMERNILYCFASGMSMKEVEVKYQFADNTLRAHRRNMMQKNNCTYEKLLSCFHHFPPEVPFDPNFAAKKGSK
jgi:two-component system uhpT operon response regulator UhpA